MIFEIHLRKRKLEPAHFDLGALANSADGFSGSKFEQAVVASLYSAHAQKTQLNQTTLVRELATTRPLSTAAELEADAVGNNCYAELEDTRKPQWDMMATDAGYALV